jgi:hypothetical protein
LIEHSFSKPLIGALMYVTDRPTVQKTTGSRGRSALPLGLKLALTMSATMLALFIGLIAMLMFLSAESLNITKVKAIASSFMNITDPLPDGYEYKSGVDLLGLKVVLISYPKTGTSWTIVHTSTGGSQASPESLIHQIEATAESSRKIMCSPGTFTVSQKGAQDVGGKPFFYEAGQLLSGGAVSGALVGCFKPDNSGTTCIFGSTPAAQIDFFANDELLQKIKLI